MCETLADSVVKGRVAVAPLPSAAPGKQGRVPERVLASLHRGAGKPARRRGRILDFFRHCASAESDKLLTMEGAIGCRKSTWHDPEVNRAIPIYRALEEIHRHARELPRLVHWSQVAAVIDRFLVTKALDSDTPHRCESSARPRSARPTCFREARGGRTPDREGRSALQPCRPLREAADALENRGLHERQHQGMHLAPERRSPSPAGEARPRRREWDASSAPLTSPASSQAVNQSPAFSKGGLRNRGLNP